MNLPSVGRPLALEVLQVFNGLGLLLLHFEDRGLAQAANNLKKRNRMSLSRLKLK